MTEALYPPEGTPDGALFYVRDTSRGQHGDCYAAIWHRGWWTFFDPSMLSPAERMPKWGTWAIVSRIPDPEHLLRHEQRVRELLEANNRLVEENRLLRAAVRDAASAMAEGVIAARQGAEPLVPIRRRDGEPPCGECHLHPGETCDICGAVRPPCPTVRALREGGTT